MTKLKKAATFPLLACYGIGTILGAGIYVLIGKVAAESGMQAPFAFILAAVIAAFTAYSYAELSSRYPKSGGEAVYVLHGFGSKPLSALVGWLIIFTGIVSAATMANGFVGYLDLFVHIPRQASITALVLTLGILAVWGISESLWIVAVITFVEVAGLVLVLFAAGDVLVELPGRYPELLPGSSLADWTGIALGGFLAFYAYIGFEDMVNIAEEVKEPKKNLPRAIFLALGISTIFYILLALVAILAVPLQELAASEAPLALILETRGYRPTLIGVISLFAVVNGALVQIIMASRVAYGMGMFGLANSWLAHVHEKTQTPVAATVLATLAVLVLALVFPLVTLAKLTSLIILMVFTLVNLSLVKIKKRKQVWIPLTGALFCVLLILLQIGLIV